jgi:hypothetical protein
MIVCLGFSAAKDRLIPGEAVLARRGSFGRIAHKVPGGTGCTGQPVFPERSAILPAIFIFGSVTLAEGAWCR